MRVYKYKNNYNKNLRPKNQVLRNSRKKSYSKSGSLSNLFNLNGFLNNGFFFQILGVVVLTSGILLSFQSLVDLSSQTVSASPVQSNIRVVNDFENSLKSNSKNRSRSNLIYDEEGVEIIPSNSQIEDQIEESEETIENEFEPVAESSQKTHTVEDGDTLTSIASANNMRAFEIIEINDMQEPFDIQIGQVLVVER